MRRFVLALALAAGWAGADEGEDLQLQERLRAHIDFLAADELRGRQPGTEGYDIAARYVASQFRQIGLVPGDFTGNITFAGNTCRTGCARMLVDAATRDLLQASMKPVTHLDIAADPAFQSRFIRNLSFG